MKKTILIGLISLVVLSCAGSGSKATETVSKTDAPVLPISGTFINLAYQDVRNKYTNPLDQDDTDPQVWSAKIAEMKAMGMEYLVFMAVANEGKAFYPSELMDLQYPSWRKSPVDAIMDAAASHGMKVFMSTGWAKDQDDNLRDPKIKGRQLEMMEELAGIYREHPAFYGWYLPVEDCLGPVLTDYAVEAVNALTARARELTPSAKILISPYGIFNSDFDDPRYEQQILRLNVDIIAYQDEVGCVREKYPLTRLRENWKKLRAIHDKSDIEMWANCESFTWERGTNDRTSALIPASFSRLLSQQAAATAGGVDRIISFMMCGIYSHGQPQWSSAAGKDYMSWSGGDPYWKTVEDVWLGKYGEVAVEDATDGRWQKYAPGTHEVVLELGESVKIDKLILRFLNCAKDGIIPPVKTDLYGVGDSGEWAYIASLASVQFPNTLHDAFVDHLVYSAGAEADRIKVVFTAETDVYMDRIIVERN
jgi:hypothetical protein